LKGFLLLRKEKQFTWPDKPILFDDLEELFLQASFQSPLMYCHLTLEELERLRNAESALPGGYVSMDFRTQKRAD